jgi:hypothetical protein
LASTQPDSTVIVSFRASSERMRFMRASDTTISRRDPVGTEPPESPVLPPCGTSATRSRAQCRTTSETSRVLAGRTTHSAFARYCLRQSLK